MSKKRCDNKNRWRNKIVAFRMSPEEAEQLDVLAKLSGLSKQDYLISRVLKRDVIVQGNLRVYKMLRNQLLEVVEELKRLSEISKEDDELLELIQFMTEMMMGLKSSKEENDKENKKSSAND